MVWGGVALRGARCPRWIGVRGASNGFAVGRAVGREREAGIVGAGAITLWLRRPGEPGVGDRGRPVGALRDRNGGRGGMR
jgi:hypothetical protein